MRVRVVDDGLQFNYALAVTLPAAALVLGALAFFSPGHLQYGLEIFGLALSFWSIGPAFVLRRKRQATTAEVVNDGLRIGSLTLTKLDVDAISVARGSVGWSIAITTAKRTYFLEVSSQAEVDAVFKALGSMAESGSGKVRTESLSSWAQVIPYILGSIGCLAGICYALFYDTPMASPIGARALFGLSGLAIGIIQTLLLLARLNRPRVAWNREGVYVRHTFFDKGSVVADLPGSLLLTAVDPPSQQVSIVSDELLPHLSMHVRQALGWSGATSESSSPIRVQLEQRPEEKLEAWLARLDGTRRADGYRSDAPTEAELWSLLQDTHANEPIRLGSARILHLLYGVSEERLCDAVNEEELLPRIRAVCRTKAEEAQAELERLGPAFRAS